MADDIAAVKSRLNIVDVVKAYVPTLKKAGRNYTAPCPFHQEKTPSFMVNPDLQFYKCFGCGAYGDVISFIQQIERLEFREALQVAAEKAGYQLSNVSENTELKVQIEKLVEINTLAMEFWHFLMIKHQVAEPARVYAKKRGIRLEEVKKFKLGYGPAGDNLVKFLTKKGMSTELMLQAGLVVDRNGQLIDKFRQRLVLPILNMKGQPVGFSGRIIVTDSMAPKYLNSPETLLYKKSEILMGLYQAKDAARKANFLILEEGNLDLMASHKVGVENIAATGGTAITQAQLKLVQRYADSVYFCFDSDQAGIKALVKGLELAEEIGLQHKVINIGKYKDPDDLIQHEPQLWAQLIANPLNTVSHLLNVYAKEVDLATADGKSRYVKLMLPVLRALKDPVQQEHFINELAVATNTTIDAIRGIVKAAAQPELIAHRDETATSQPVTEKVEPADSKELYFLALLTASGEITQWPIAAEVFLDADCKTIYQLMLASSPNPNFSELGNKLSPRGQHLLQEILTTSLPDTVDVEIQKTYQLLFTKYLRRQLLQLRQQLKHDSENTELLNQMQALTVQLQQLER
jgi:DNA primase